MSHLEVILFVFNVQSCRNRFKNGVHFSEETIFAAQH